MSNEKNNAADDKILVIVPIVFAGFLILIGVLSYTTMIVLAIMSISFGLFLAIPYSIILLKSPKYASFVFFTVAGVFLIVIGVATIFTVGYTYYAYMPQIVSIVGGFVLFIGSPISFAVKNERLKKIDSMSQSDLAKMFDCPSSGNKGVVHVIKLVKDQILVKHRCPPSGVKLFRIPLRLKDQCVPYFRDAVFRCFKCGQEATVDRVILSGPWTLIKLSCPTHGNNLPTYKIWSTVFNEISNEGFASPLQVQSQPIPSEKNDSKSQSDLDKMFTCPECGSIVATYLIKPVKDQILVKQKCPNHLEKVRRIPLRLKNQCISHFRDTVFRCFKCGQEATVDHVKFSGPWALIKLSCPTHGNKIPTHKIWSIVYSDISNEGIATPQQVQPQPIPSEEKRFCRMCGERYKDAYQKVCQNCGSERDI